MVMILLAPGFEEAEALVPADLLRRAGVEVQLVGVGGSCITGSHGITVAADLALEQADTQTLEMLVLPGGLGGVRAIQNSPAALELIRRAHRQGTCLAAICAAPSIFGFLGFLKNRKATAYPSFMNSLEGAETVEDQVAVDGNVTTSRGLGTAIPFALSLIEQLLGKEKAEEIAESVVYS